MQQALQFKATHDLIVKEEKNLFNFSGDNVETLELTEQTVNPGEPKTGPQDFELLKLLGKGGYGKAS